jgi:hypothetical protein
MIPVPDDSQQRLPENTSFSRFCVDLNSHVLPVYLKHERTFDEPGIHGRMHVCRCLLFGEFMCRYYLRHAVLPPAFDDVRYAIAFHDAGRKANGPDLWGYESAALCAEYVSLHPGQFSRSPAEMAALIAAKDAPGASIEARIVHDADVLDIMRPCCGHGGRDGFWEERLLFLGVRDEVQDAGMRKRLIEEAWTFIGTTEERKHALRDSSNYLSDMLAILEQCRLHCPTLVEFLCDVEADQ